MKLCQGCDTPKPLDDFHKSSRIPDGRQSRCKECCRGSSKAWREANREEARKRSRDTVARLKEKVFAGYGNRCHCCGEAEERFLTIDHVNNDGTTHRRAVGEGYDVYRWAVNNNFPKTLTLSCFNCNQGRGFNNGVCPHKIAKPIAHEDGWVQECLLLEWEPVGIAA